MERYSFREVIEQAIQTEKLGHDFYAAMAKRFKEHEQLKSLFEMLATKELQHEKRFLALKNGIKEQEPEGWEEVSSYLRAIVESEFFLGKNRSLPSLEHLTTVKDALHYALGFERETLLYYYGMKDVLMDTGAIDEIVKEEKSHIVWLSQFKNTLKT